MRLLRLLPPLTVLLVIVQGFSPSSLQSQRKSVKRTVVQAVKADLFTSDGWKPIEEDLDQVPIFTVATKEGNPLAYEVKVKEQSYTVPFFYCDVDDAVNELEASRNNTKLEGIDLIPFPLGKAFKLWATDQAVIIPSKEAVLQAGAPPNVNPIGRKLHPRSKSAIDSFLLSHFALVGSTRASTSFRVHGNCRGGT